MKLNQYEWDPEKDLLGAGSYAEVFRAKDNSDNLVALKIYTESVIKSTTGGSNKGKYSLQNEFEKGKLLSHTNVIKYLGFDFLTSNDVMGRALSYPVLTMEYAESGSLENWIKSSFPPDIDEALLITREILKGLSYLHDQGIIHRDLKPGNIMFKKDRLGKKVAKIVDFGISRDLLEENTVMQSTGTLGIGTTSYMAPEQFRKKAFGLDGNISNRTDLWALGVIFYRLLTGKLPFNERNNDYEELSEEIINIEPDYSNVPVKFQSVIKGCLQKKASDRLSNAQQVLTLLNQLNANNPVPDPDATRTIVVEKPGQQVVPPVKPPVRPPVKPPFKPKSNATNPLLIVFGVAIIVVIAVVLYNSNKSGKNGPNYSSGDAVDSANMADSSKMTVPPKIKVADTTKATANPDGNNSDNGYVTEKKIRLKLGDSIYTVVYSGVLVNGVPNGYGTKRYISGEKDGDKYEGYSKNGLANGTGTYSAHNGYSYSGDWKDGEPNGSGIQIYSNSDKYVGEFVNGVKSGTGTLYRNYDDESKGNVYTGEWANDYINGSGTYKWNDGRVYTGDFANNQLTGDGTMIYADGSKYTGQWLNGKPNGYGKYYDKYGSLSYSGQYENGVQKDQ